MINIANILKQNIFGKLLNHGIVFIINIIIVRLLGANISGSYFNELYLVNFIVFIFSAGLDYAAIAWLSREPRLLPVIHRFLLKVVLFFLVVVLLIGFSASNLLTGFFQQPLPALMLFGAGNLLLIFYQGLLSAQKKFNLQNILSGITNLLFLLYLIFFFSANTQELFKKLTISYAALLFVQGVLMTFASWMPLGDRHYKVNWTPFFKHGLFIMLSSLVYFAFLRIDNFFVERYTDPKTLSNYVQCGKIGQYFLYFSSIISSTLLPFISSQEAIYSLSGWKKMMRPYVLLICIGAVFIALLGGFVYPLLFGEEFNQMQQYMLIFLPGFVCLGILTLINAVYLGNGNIKRIFLGDILGLLLVAAMDGLLVPAYGAKAAAMISSGAYCLLFLFLYKDLRKQFAHP
jgi:O-antigen/teichoic acid export membrane protein